MIGLVLVLLLGHLAGTVPLSKATDTFLFLEAGMGQPSCSKNTYT